MSGFFRQVDEAAAFNADKAAKADLFRGSRLFVGLNCFEAGQSQATHVHAGRRQVLSRGIGTGANDGGSGDP